MGFFDFLNRRPAAPGPGDPFEPLPADLSSTRTIQALLEVPREARNQEWSHQFLVHVADAAFYTREPSVVLGTERLPFFALYSTAPGQAFPAHVIHHMKDDFLLERGMGVVINPQGPNADWAFSYGDLLNFHLHGAFYPAQNPPCPDLPAEARLPQPARRALRGFLAKLGATEPRVLFGTRDHAGPGSLELVFGFSPQDFRSMEDFQFAMSNLSWFLPRNYSYSVAGSQARREGRFELL